MSDDPTAPVPLDPVEPKLDALDAPDAPDALDEEATAATAAPMRAVAPDPDVDRSRGLARDLALGAIAFVAVLLLLLGATRLMQRGAGEPTPSASQVAAAPSLSPTPSDTASPTPVPSAGPGGSAGSATPSGSAGASPSFSFPIDDPVLVGAGDIAACGATGDEDTAALLDAIAGTVFTAGDNAYESGSAREFAKCYQPSWGRHLARTRPAPGNHDWGTNGLKGYFDYFGAAAQGPDGSSWYSYDLGTWHIIMLDSSCHEVGGCDAASPQGRWLAADLARSSAACTMAIFHHPRFSSGEHGDIKAMDGFWRPLYAAGVDVIVNGHDHNYERFVPQDPDGKADPTRGIKQFVVGTGGGELRNFVRKAHNSEMRIANGYGVIAFTLHEGTYDWVFTVAGADFQDTGRHACH
jgi:3',5'-cyclic AMP phosphodiesterase CpdA